MLKNVKILFSSLVAILFVAILLVACQKSGVGKNESQQLSVYLTDHPGEFENVFVQINKVEAKIDTSTRKHDDDHGDKPGDFDQDGDDHQKGKHDEFGTWQELSFRAGSYDVLALRNGVDTLLASGTVTGTVRKIRLTVGSVSVVKNGVTYPVQLLLDQNNYIYIHVRKEHMRDSSDHKKLWLDFDLGRSIIEVNGAFYLRPVLKPFHDLTSGQVSGTVLPLDAKATVKLFNNKDTAVAIPGREGRYKIRALNEGIYNVSVTSANGYKEATLTNITVTKGRETKIPTITLIK